MRANGDGDYELSLSDSEEEASTNDESSDDQTGSQNHRGQNHVAAIPAMQCQQLLSKLQHLVFLPCYVLQGLLNIQGKQKAIDRNPPPKGKKRP